MAAACRLYRRAGSLIYDGNEHTATVNKSQDWQGDTVAEADIKYTKDGDNTVTGNPKDAGTYTASITVGGVTASVTYTIRQAVPQAGDFAFSPPDTLTYDGSARTAAVGGQGRYCGHGRRHGEIFQKRCGD